jgi:hypothetical protein
MSVDRESFTEPWTDDENAAYDAHFFPEGEPGALCPACGFGVDEHELATDEDDGGREFTYQRCPERPDLRIVES